MLKAHVLISGESLTRESYNGTTINLIRKPPIKYPYKKESL